MASRFFAAARKICLRLFFIGVYCQNMDNALIFDFDGTLAETFPLIFKAVHLAYLKLGIQPPDKETVYANFGPHELGLLLRLNPDRAFELFDAYLGATKELIAQDGLAPFDGVRQTLEAARARGYKMAIITNKSRETLDISLDALGLREFFGVLKWGGETGSMKPRRLREVLDAFSISPQQATYIGDSVADIEDCRQVGVPVLSAAWAKCANIEALRRHNPEGVILSPLEILAR